MASNGSMEAKQNAAGRMFAIVVASIAAYRRLARLDDGNEKEAGFRGEARQESIV